VEKIKQSFRKYDKDGDGSISMEEMSSVLRSLTNLSESDIDVVFKLMDTSKDGKIQIEEFINWTMLPDSSDDFAVPLILGSLREVFRAFCPAGTTTMEQKSFTKLCKDCCLFDARFQSVDSDLLFSKLMGRERRMDYGRFQEALKAIAGRRRIAYRDICRDIESTGGPLIQGTHAEAVRFHDDKSTYTGTHAHGVLDSDASGTCVGGHHAVPHALPHRHPPGHHRHSSCAASERTSQQEAVTMVAGGRPTTRVSMPSIEGAFRTHCGRGQADMDSRAFAKLCSDCCLFDSKFLSPDADIVFSKVAGTSKRMNCRQLAHALQFVADKKGISLEEVECLVKAGSAPQWHGTVSENNRFHDDAGTYTGVHKHGGPESVAKGTGSATVLASRGMH